MTGRFGSVITAMVTPFREDHAVDLDVAQELAAHLLDHGSDAIVVAGSTGESPTLTYKEKAELFRAVGEAVHGRGHLICGTGTYSTAETLELTQAAEDAGADGLLVVTPYYNKPPQRGLVAHFERIADATDLPIIAYNIPGRTATRIEHDTLLTLSQKSNIVAVKDSTGDFQGEISLLDGGPRTATVTTTTATTVMVATRGEFLALLDEAPEIARQMLPALAHRVRALNAATHTH